MGAPGLVLAIISQTVRFVVPVDYLVTEGVPVLSCVVSAKEKFARGKSYSDIRLSATAVAQVTST
jgi:hypothetical protein